MELIKDSTEVIDSIWDEQLSSTHTGEKQAGACKFIIDSLTRRYFIHDDEVDVMIN
jgi:hypothetical protein